MPGLPPSCPTATRIGVARAAAFGSVSTGTPLLAHDASAPAVLVTWLALAAWFAAWTWSRSCRRPRGAVALAVVFAAGQLATHVAYALAASITSPAGAVHEHGAAAATAATGAATPAPAMLLVHLVAALAGAAIVALLDLRVAAAAVRLARRIRRVVDRLLGRERAPRTLAPIASLTHAACDALARRSRRVARAHARRGPPPGSVAHA